MAEQVGSGGAINYIGAKEKVQIKVPRDSRIMETYLN
jgi:hypothetical protein